MEKSELSDHWNGDLLGYKDVSANFFNFIKSIDEAKVISIEAGFGRGKTFFRKRWAQDLRDSGETVVEIDTLKSDHSGDPILTFVGALVAAVPIKPKTKAEEAISVGKKYGGLVGKAVVKAVGKNAFDELIDNIEGKAIDQLEDFEMLQSVVSDFGDGMSKLAGQMIAAQLAAERVREEELPEQLTALHKALTQEAGSDRVVVIIDELDRCQTDYAIAVLEAMKVVFDHPGFVFCLMINPEFLESLAEHRFGRGEQDESYLDKFIDIRLRLPFSHEIYRSAVEALTSELPLAVPFGDSDEFSIQRAAKLAGDMAALHEFSMRQIKRLLLRVRLALTIYSAVPLDASLLVFLAFDPVLPPGKRHLAAEKLPRVILTPGTAEIRPDHRGQYNGPDIKLARGQCAPIFNSALMRHRLGEPPKGKRWHEEHMLFAGIAPWYIPEHQAMLDAVHSLVVD